MELRRLLSVKNLVLLVLLVVLSCFVFYREQLKWGSELIYGDVVGVQSVQDCEQPYDIFDIAEEYDKLINTYKSVRKKLTDVDTDTLLYSLRRECYNGFDTSENNKYVFIHAFRLFDRYIRYIEGYYTDVEQRLEASQRLAFVDIFSDENSYTRNSILKASADMKELLSVEQEAGNTISFDRLMEYNFIHYAMLIMIIFTVIDYMTQRKQGIWELVHTTRYGRGRLALRRFGLLLVLCVFYSAVMYLAVTIVSIILYGGLDSFGEPLQGSMMFASSMLFMNRWQYLIFHILYCAIAMASVGTLVWAVMSLIRNITLTYITVAAIFAAEYFLYISTGPLSRYSALFYFNIFNLINPTTSFAQYGNWGVGKFILGTDTINIIFMCVVAALFFAAAMLCEVFYYPAKRSGVNPAIGLYIRRLVSGVLSSLNLLFKELYKLLFTQKGIIVFVIYIVLIFQARYEGNIYYDDKGVLMKEYYARIEGMDMASIYEVISDYEEEYGGYTAEYEACRAALAEGGEIDASYMEQLADKIQMYEAALSEMHAQYERIEQLNSAGVGASVINEYEYKDMFGEKSYYSQTTFALYAVCAEIFLLYGLFSFEKRQGMEPLVRTTVNGRKLLFRRKSEAAVIIVTLVFFTAYIPNLIQLARIYAFDNLEACIRSLEQFAVFPFNISIGGFIILSCAVKYLLLLSVAMYIVLVSVFMEYRKSMLASLVILVPYFLETAGIKSFGVLSLIDAFNMPYFFISHGGSAVVYIVYGAVIAAGVVCFIISRRKWIK